MSVQSNFVGYAVPPPLMKYWKYFRSELESYGVSVSGTTGPHSPVTFARKLTSEQAHSAFQHLLRAAGKTIHPLYVFAGPVTTWPREEEHHAVAYYLPLTGVGVQEQYRRIVTEEMGFVPKSHEAETPHMPLGKVDASQVEIAERVIRQLNPMSAGHLRLDYLIWFGRPQGADQPWWTQMQRINLGADLLERKSA